MLEIRNLSVGYGKKPVLKNLNLSIAKNKITAIAGRNGCGKSTLISCITKKLKYSGDIFFNEINTAEMNVKQMSKCISSLPQRLENPHILVSDLVMFGRNPYMGFSAKPTEEDFRQVRLAMEITKTTGLCDKYTDEISGGERQRAFLAMILAQNTPFIILDEPATYMDISHSRELFEILYRLKEEHEKTFLIVMHDLSSAVKYADEIAVIDGGEAIFSGTALKCVQSGVLEATFDVKLHSFDKNGKRFDIFE